MKAANYSNPPRPVKPTFLGRPVSGGGRNPKGRTAPRRAEVKLTRGSDTDGRNCATAPRGPFARVRRPGRGRFMAPSCIYEGLLPRRLPPGANDRDRPASPVGADGVPAVGG